MKLSTIPTSHIYIKKIQDPNLVPVRAYAHDAGLDLKSATKATIDPGAIVSFKTGIFAQIPEGYVGLLFPRSSTKVRLANTVGVIDSSYRGEIIVKLENASDKPVTIGQYDRICQLVIVPIICPTPLYVDELDPSPRGEGGFGSTGK
jgi:dUTP pyrophosphatase